MKNNLQKRSARLLAAVLLLSCFLGVIPTSAEQELRVPYMFSIDDLNGRHISGSMIGVIRDMILPFGGEINAKGWLTTPEGVSAYEYLWVPVGGASARWETVKEAQIFPRGDLKPAGIPHPSGHDTAGFSLRIQPPEGTAEGYYDVYIRAVDGAGATCDLVALLDLRYGEVDYDDRKAHRINFSRLLREGEDALSGSPILTESALTLGDGDLIRLGHLNLLLFDQLRITYKVSPGGLKVGDDRRPILGLKSSGEYGYGAAGEPYNLTDHLACNALRPETDEGILQIDLTDCTYNGEVWLSGYLGGKVTVTEVELVYSGYVTDRVSARIRFSSDLAGYFLGHSYTTLSGVTDPVLGDVLRMEVSEATNDPYVHFDAGKLLEDHGLALNADDYSYMVILYRAEARNTQQHATFYLCAGAIAGATESCTKGVTWQADGNWHYMLLDLSETENWTGIINGWRFDYLSGDSRPGDAVEFASVQFFRTYEKAAEYAAKDPLVADPFHLGDVPVVRDMSEDQGEDNYVIDPEDSFVVTQPAELPTDPVEPSTLSPDDSESLPGTDPVGSGSSDGKGCASLMSLWAVVLLPVGAILVSKRRKRTK